MECGFEEIQKKQFKGKIDVVDLNKQMLNEGKKRINDKNINFYLQNAENLNFRNNTYDKYLISFCLRNITNLEQSLTEAFRILKPGGTYYCLEFSKPNSFIISEERSSLESLRMIIWFLYVSITCVKLDGIFSNLKSCSKPYAIRGYALSSADKIINPFGSK